MGARHQRKLNHIPLFPDAWIRDTSHLTAEQDGIYLRLIMAAWDAPDCTLPHDPRRLAAIARISMTRWAKVSPEILELWTIQSGRIYQKRLLREWHWVQEKSAKSRAAVNARWERQAPDNKGSAAYGRITNGDTPLGEGGGPELRPAQGYPLCEGEGGMRKTVDIARGKWRGVLLQLGVEDRYLQNKHGPCPLCGGRDRYRWDNQAGNGTYICSGCGAGNGLDLLMKVNNWSFRDAAREVDKLVGNLTADPLPREVSDEQRLRLLNELWQRSVPAVTGDMVGAYLCGRGVDLPAASNVLRFCESCRAPDGSRHPAMLAMVSDKDGAPITLHRTFLGPAGKAKMDEPRALMPGKVPAGSAVRLAPIAERLGIAEGIETALAATRRFGVPTWAALNANMLKQWEVPDGVREVVVFGDCDQKFAGEASAFALAHRLAVKGLNVSVEIPAERGTDWADAA